ncbi:MAG: alkaline phosphatase [Clostridia bacterium]|jgi:alkaline phosphatase|nr:alkaline phosphatase [Clostridia bacterium]
MRTRTVRLWTAVLLVVVLFVASVSWAAPPAAGSGVRNAIILIPDGLSLDAITLARWYQDGKPLAMDEIICGLVRTYSADAPIADSAPAATAFATGFKSHTGYVGVLPDVAAMPGQAPIDPSEARRPVATVLEAARLAGKATGLVVTCELPHATPAGFSAHYPDRNNYDDILEQQVYQGLDVVLGGGYQYMAAKARKDGEDLVQVVKSLGYEYVTTPEELRWSTADRIWGMFAPKDLAYDFDRDPAKEPSLAEMTRKAIEVLSRDPEGFFLMVEGSKIDWAAHANDPIGVISDTLAFDAAVRAALDFAKRDGRTVVIVVPDHGNGGISIGDGQTSSNYDKLTLSDFLAPLKQAKLTGEGVEKKLNPDRSNLVEVVRTYYGITDLTEEEIKALKEAPAGRLNYVLGPIISRRAHIGWTTNGHTGEDVVLGVYSPSGQRPEGVVENTKVARYMEKSLALNLQQATEQLFVPALAAFRALGAQVFWDESAPSHPVLEVVKGNTVLRLPVNKNLAEVNGQAVTLEGITVFNGKEVYFPREALSLLGGAVP